MSVESTQERIKKKNHKITRLSLQSDTEEESFVTEGNLDEYRLWKLILSLKEQNIDGEDPKLRRIRCIFDSLNSFWECKKLEQLYPHLESLSNNLAETVKEGRNKADRRAYLDDCKVVWDEAFADFDLYEFGAKWPSLKEWFEAKDMASEQTKRFSNVSIIRCRDMVQELKTFIDMKNKHKQEFNALRANKSKPNKPSPNPVPNTNTNRNNDDLKAYIVGLPEDVDEKTNKRRQSTSFGKAGVFMLNLIYKKEWYELVQPTTMLYMQQGAVALHGQKIL